jgi:hypothetical protein
VLDVKSLHCESYRAAHGPGPCRVHGGRGPGSLAPAARCTARRRQCAARRAEDGAPPFRDPRPLPTLEIKGLKFEEQAFIGAGLRNHALMNLSCALFTTPKACNNYWVILKLDGDEVEIGRLAWTTLRLPPRPGGGALTLSPAPPGFARKQLLRRARQAQIRLARERMVEVARIAAAEVDGCASTGLAPDVARPSLPPCARSLV